MNIRKNWTKRKTPMERIKQIWHQLETDNFAVAGLLKLRYSETARCDAFLGVKTPEMYRMLNVRVPFQIGKEFKLKYEFRGLKFEKIYDPDDSNFLLLNLVLIDRQFKDVFDSLISDVLEAIIDESDIKVILKSYSNRLVKWQSLFERLKQPGLTPEEQRGLFGEMFFLRKYLRVNSDSRNVVISWVGSEKQVRDFQFGSWSLEVKTTFGNNHQKVHISSERQLDKTNLEFLFLNHISLELRQLAGETLNQIVDSIGESLESDYSAYNQFKSKLIEAGFFDHHRHIYEDIGYFIREDDYYMVRNQFPRIEESDIRNGVGDVKYSIIVSQCNDYKISEVDVFIKLKFS
jgi:hypothetical protein